MDGLVIDNVSMVFTLPNGGKVHALQDVSLHLKPGELMAVLGPSGCGKTTLLNIVGGFLAPTAGQALLNGHQVTGPHKERGVVFQQGALFEWMTVAQNVSFGPRMCGVPRAETKQIVRPPARHRGAAGVRRQAGLSALRRHAAARGTGAVPGERP